jgi:hypothetical protein
MYTMFYDEGGENGKVDAKVVCGICRGPNPNILQYLLKR